MNDSNPYRSPSGVSEAMDPNLLRALALRLAQARKNPPTTLRLLCTWPGTPLLMLVGVVGTVILAYLSWKEGATINAHWPIGYACFFAGAVLREFRLARHVASSWKPHTHFIDWKKVDELCE